MKGLISLTLVTIFLGCNYHPPEKTGLEGQEIPNFSILLTDSSTYLNSKEISSGKPTVLIYFSPHCIYSRAEIIDIVDNIKGIKDLNIYLVSDAELKDIKSLERELMLNKYPNIKIGRDYNEFISNYYEAEGVPFTAIYGKNRRLLAAFDGKVSARQIRNCANG